MGNGNRVRPGGSAGAESAAAAVMDRYPLASPRSVDSLGNAGGFSGAQLWKIEAGGRWCLRRWPRVHPTRSGLAWIHALLIAAQQAGIESVASPILNRAGKTITGEGGHLWEITEWKPGQADFLDDPQPDRLRAILIEVARVHEAFAKAAPTASGQPSPGLAERLERLQGLPTLMNRLQSASVPPAHPAARALFDLQQRGRGEEVAALAHRCAARLRPAAECRFRCQPVLRDLRQDHVLLTGTRVTGLVDFGAMGIDTVALDLARLLDSLLPDQPDAWESCLEIYAEEAPLEASEREWVPALADANLLISWSNWLRWLVIEERTFEHLDQAVRRLNQLHDRLFPQPAGPL